MTARLDKDLGEIISRLSEIFLHHFKKAAVQLVITIKIKLFLPLVLARHGAFSPHPKSG